MTVLLRTEGLAKAYDQRTAVSDVSIRLNEGDILGIMGPSGSGKSTLLRLMDLLELPSSGKVYFEEREVSPLDARAHLVRREMALVLQRPLAMNRSVFNNVAFGLQIRQLGKEAIGAKVIEQLERLGLTEVKDRNAKSLSGGEMQRMCFARSIIVEPKILLLDEFTANLDPQNISILEKAVRDFVNKGGKAAVVVSHNLFQTKRLCNRAALIMNGAIVEEGETSKLFQKPTDERTREFVSGEMIY